MNPKENESLFIEAYKKSPRTCAALFKMSMHTCYYWANKFCIRGKNRKKNIQKNEFEIIYKTHTIKQTAEHFGIHPRKVSRLVSFYKIMKEKRWSKNDILYVKENFKTTSIIQISKKLGRSEESIKNIFYKKT